MKLGKLMKRKTKVEVSKTVKLSLHTPLKSAHVPKTTLAARWTPSRLPPLSSDHKRDLLQTD